ncbi:MAG: TatD family hydrolase [Patescibacteria group bacterium]
MKLFDTHTHVNFNAFKNDWQGVIARALENNVWLVNVGSQSTTSKRAVEITENYKEGVYAAVGLHPSHLFEQEINKLEAGEKIHYKTRGEEFDENYYLELAKNEKVVAIGECGLDYYRIRNNELGIKEKQKDVFKKQIELAIKLNLPLIIHCRDAHEDLLEILKAKSYKLKAKEAGVMHFFTGTLEQAKKYIDSGFYISFSGVITFTNAYDDIVKNLPFDKILIETDAPYVSPAPYRGKRNEPSYIIEIVKKIAEIKRVPLEEVAEQVTRNAKNVFNIKN